MADLEEASKPQTSPERLAVLAESEDSLVRRAVARNESAASETLMLLSDDGHEDVVVGVAANPSTPADLLRILSGHPESVEVEQAAISNPSFPADDLQKLALTGDSRKREGVALNPCTPADILTRLATRDPFDDEEERIVIAVAGNPSLPLEVIKSLIFGSDNYSVVERACGNPALPPRIIVGLTTVELWKPHGWIAVPTDAERGLASNPSAPIEVLIKLASHEDWTVRLKVALNPSTTAEVLDILATDINENVRNGVAQNPCATDEQKETVAFFSP